MWCERGTDTIYNAEVEVGCTGYIVDVLFVGRCVVKDDTQTLDLFRGRNVGIINC